MATAAAIAYSGATPASNPSRAARPAIVSGHIQLGQSILTAMWRLAYPPRLAPVGRAEGRLRSPSVGASV